MSASPGERAPKLKQARLPFFRVAPETAPPSKKPRLEESSKADIPETPKSPKESPSPADSPVIVEDEESPEEVICEPVIDKIVHPYVPLVDQALKRKLGKKRNLTKKSSSEIETDQKQGPESVNTCNSTSELSSLPTVIIDSDDSKSCDPSESTESKTLIDDSPTPMEVDEPNIDESPEPNAAPVIVCDDENKINSESKSDPPAVELKTPKSNKRSSTKSNEVSVPDTPKTPNSQSKLTPKQLQKKLESAEKRKEKERDREEREKKKQEEKDLKAKQKQEKDEQRKKEKEEKEEQKKKEKEEKEEQKKKEKEEKERIKEEMKEQKRKEKELKEEEKRKTEDEEKARKEKEKKKAAALFANFFVPKNKMSKNENIETDPSETLKCNHNFLSNFTIKCDMRLAPIIRRQMTDNEKQKLSDHLAKPPEDKIPLYLSNIKSKEYNIKSSPKTWPLEELKNDIMIIEDDLPPVEENQEIEDVPHPNTLRPKLLSFSENRRPAYWGTWRKKSNRINGRRPFVIDKTHLDYTCDSDEEWEEEEPGESVESVAGSDDEEEENEYDVDNDFMVPHGYLSDEEALGEDDNALTPEALKAKLKYLEHEFEDEMKKPTTVKKPRVVGIVWQNSEGGKPNTCAEAVWNFLSQKSILMSENEIIIHSSGTSLESEQEDNEKTNLKKNRKISDDMIPALIKLVHGNINNKGFLIKEFLVYISKSGTSLNGESTENNEEKIINKDISKISIARKIKEISTWMPCPEEGAMYSRMCWFVEKEVREKYGLGNLQLPNDWSYTLTPRNKSDSVKKEKQTKPIPEILTVMKESPISKKENVFNITKFTKKMTQEERDKQFVSNNGTNMTSEKEVTGQNTETQPEKKRIPLLFLGPKEKTPSNSPNVTDSKQNDTQKSNPEPDKTNPSSKKKKVSFVTLDTRTSTTTKPVRTNLLTQFIKTAPEKYSQISEKDSDECVVLSD